MESVEGGFYLKARKIKGSAIAKAPPHVREIWDWILMNANFADRGNLKRGQLIASYDQIIEDLSWYVGYRKMTYKKHHCETAMKLLVKHTMVTTTKTARGMIITVCNYDKYQDPANYESRNGAETKTTRKPHENRTKTEECKKEKKETLQAVGTSGQEEKAKEEGQSAEERFSAFWESYPRKIEKKRAAIVWKQKNCGNGKFNAIMAKLEEYKRSDQWQRDNGRYIPHPATWLNGERWNDELSCQVPQGGQKVGGLTF